MAFWSSHSSHFLLLGLLSLFLLHPTAAIRLHIVQKSTPSATTVPAFREAPAFRNGDMCCREHNYDIIHIVMPLDSNYIRGTIAAVLSILQHSTCPENVSFHFLSAHLELEIYSLIKSTFPYLTFKMYHFDSNRVRGKISKSIRQALDQPLNYARIYMSDILLVSSEGINELDKETASIFVHIKLQHVSSTSINCQCFRCGCDGTFSQCIPQNIIARNNLMQP